MTASKDSKTGPKKRKLKTRKKKKQNKEPIHTTNEQVIDNITTDVYSTLNHKQQRFVDEYMIDSNAYRAYCMAGYSGRGNSGYVSASQLLKNPKVKAAIEHRRGLISATLKVTQEDVIKELKLIAFSNIGDYVQFGGKKVRLKASHELSREHLSVIEQVVEQTNTAGLKSIKLKLHPKLAALGILAKFTEVDKPDSGAENQTAETLAQALSDMAGAMSSTLPTSENREVDASKKKKKKKLKKTDCPICEVPKDYCSCED